MEFSKEYAVQMQDITIRFGSHCALNKVQLSVKKGTVHAILGENGAGKTTLMNILYGLYQKNAGEIYLYGKKEEIRNPSAAISRGIGMVHQHFMLVQHCVINGEYCTCYFCQHCVVVNQRCHRIASFLRLVLTKISGTLFTIIYAMMY